jgi:hypothetical protein
VYRFDSSNPKEKAVKKVAAKGIAMKRRKGNREGKKAKEWNTQWYQKRWSFKVVVKWMKSAPPSVTPT